VPLDLGQPVAVVPGIERVLAAYAFLVPPGEVPFVVVLVGVVGVFQQAVVRPADRRAVGRAGDPVAVLVVDERFVLEGYVRVRAGELSRGVVIEEFVTV
jgi:hypothetical protein